MSDHSQPSTSSVSRKFLIACSLTIASLTGCHSAFIQATVVNHTGGTLRLFEIDYPSASFGGDDLATGSTFHYRFKVIGSGPTKLSWTDAAEHEHTAKGPDLHEGDEGSLTIAIEPSGPVWTENLHPASH